jgi:3-oxoacyl-[acyl-carrier protein] reductase
VDLGLNNKTALVTGASRGLGKAVAAALAAEGAKVAICARDAAPLEAAARETGAIGFAADLSQAGAADAVLR